MIKDRMMQLFYLLFRGGIFHIKPATYKIMVSPVKIAESHKCYIIVRMEKYNYSPKLYINPFSAEIVFICQNQTPVDIRFWRIKMVPALQELKYL